MLGIIVLFAVLSIEVGFMIYCLVTKAYQNSCKYVIRFITFAVFCVLVLFQVIDGSFRWTILFSVLLIQTIIGIVLFIKKSKSEKVFKKKNVIFNCLGRCFLLTSALIPVVIFPQYNPVTYTGQYSVKTESYTLTDTNRIEGYSDTGDNRKVTIQFWYPETNTGKQKYPLAIFSHGAFGFRGSNYSTFMELASNGYVVCSIDHTYQAFFTKQTDGKTLIVNNDFLNDAIAVQTDDNEDKETFALTHEWLKLRTDDMNFVINTILENTKYKNAEGVYQLIDTDRIGLFGHSLGGATAAALGRERTDIDAVIVIDGTMIGEEVDFANGKTVHNDHAYPVPILNIYNEQHYTDASKNAENYANMVASAHAVDARQVVFNGAGHLNFTDLPLFSPFLAKQLGMGNIDSRTCIETMNSVVLDYFEYYLKSAETLDILEEY